MASIKDAFEESLQDEHALGMYVVFAIPLFMCTKFLLEADNTQNFLSTALFTIILLLGFTLKCTSNVRAGNNSVLPSFNIFPILWNGLKGTIILAPLVIIAETLKFFITELLAKFIIEPTTLQIFVVIFASLCYSIVCTGYILYAKRFRATDVYNFKTISTYCADILIAVFFMILQMILLNLIIVAPVLYLIWIFFGLPHIIATFYVCAVIVLNLAIMGHYMAQIDSETIKEREITNH